jgi:hypothetical protein
MLPAVIGAGIFKPSEPVGGGGPDPSENDAFRHGLTLFASDEPFSAMTVMDFLKTEIGRKYSNEAVAHGLRRRSRTLLRP